MSNDPDLLDTTEQCDWCLGAGGCSVCDSVCAQCDGTGQVEVRRR